MTHKRDDTRGRKKKIRVFTDLQFNWLTEIHGEQWEQWRIYAAKWISLQDTGLDMKVEAVRMLFSRYLTVYAPYSAAINLFFLGHEQHKCNSTELLQAVKGNSTQKGWYPAYCNYIATFIDWIIDEFFCEPSDSGIRCPLFRNPFRKIRTIRGRNETVYNPLPYRYIQDLRLILCPKPVDGNFNDWVWAQNQHSAGKGGTKGDWMQVAFGHIDINDPDCVWRKREFTESKTRKRTVYEIWSPVYAMALFIKLHLPLRTYQVRMLDSGEADTWRYEQGKWIENNVHSFCRGNQSHPYERGVFRRIFDSHQQVFTTGLYVNTNKTADAGKNAIDRGYVIPWEHRIVLRWLEKFRNWQEKYNPIPSPTDCTTLKRKHLGMIKSRPALEAMGNICFLFRWASAKGDDKARPVPDGPLARLWYKLLLQLESQLFERGETLKSGEKLRLVFEYPENIPSFDRTKTYFPLHSLRVSLITAYTLHTDLPLPIISKLLAGHSNLLMTIYYSKIGSGVMTSRMEDATRKLEREETESVKQFLANAELKQIKSKMAYSDAGTLEAALANRNPIGWENRHHGICLVGGNTLQSTNSSQAGGCWNGGPLIADRQNPSDRVFAPVPHGPENCVRCRWFVSDARFLPALNAHLNFLSYRASEAARLALQIENEREELEDELYLAQETGKLFLKHEERQVLHRRYEKQMTEADELAKDFLATFRLISRIIQIEAERIKGDQSDKLVAVGSADDVGHRLSIVESNSKLFQLSLICRDAEIYPDLCDDLQKTGAIQERSIALNRILMRNGYQPIFLQMDRQQQLIAGNAMLRQMAKQASSMDEFEGYHQVANYLEAEQYLIDQKLLQTGISALKPEQILTLDDPRKPKLIEA